MRLVNFTPEIINFHKTQQYGLVASSEEII